MWETIKFVGSGITLAAFIVAVGAWIYRAKILERERTIRLAPENDRRELIEHTLEFFNVDTSGLSEKAQYNLALRQIKERAARFKIAAVVVVIIAFLAAGVTVFAIWQVPTNIVDKQRPTPTPTIAPSATTTPSFPQNNLTPASNANKPQNQINTSNLSNVQTGNQNTSPLTTPDTLPRINKVSGDNMIIPAREFKNFAVRVTDANGQPLVGAKVAWQTDSKPYTYVGITDADGISTATNMYSFSESGTHTQTAVIVTRDTQTNFIQDKDIVAKIGKPVTFTFKVE